MATVRVEDAVREMTVENEDKMLELLHEASNEVVRSSSGSFSLLLNGGMYLDRS